jgi:hypothetical protein
MASKKSTAVVLPNLGLYFDRPRIAMSPRMISAGINFRVKQGRLTNLNLGWTRFGTFQLNGPVRMIKNFVIRGGSEELVFVTDTDIYRYVNDSTVTYLTPRYEVGTIAVTASNTAVGTGTLWLANVSVGDEISLNASGVIATTTSLWRTITAVTDDTHLDFDGAPTTVSGSYTIRKKFAGDIDNIWQNDIFVNATPSNEDELWMTNGLDDIVRWNGTDTQVEVMSSLGFTAKALVVYSNMMIFLNLTQSGTSKPTDMINSNPGEPQNVTTGLSEQFKVHGNVDAILRAAPLGDTLAIYSFTNDGSVTLAQFVGEPVVFAFRQVTNGVGPVAANAFADFGNYHEFIAVDGEYFFDGATVKTVNNHVWREVLRQQDPGRIQVAYSHFDEENGDLLWVLPLTSDPNSGTTGEPSEAYTEHYLEEPGPNLPSPFSRRSFVFTATGHYKRQSGLTWDILTDEWQNYNFRWNDRFFFASFPLSLGGTVDGKIYSFNTAQDADSVALASFVRFGRRATFDGRARGLISRIYPFVHTFSTPIDVTVNLMDHAAGEPTIIDEKVFDQSLPEGVFFTVHYRRGRYFEVQFGTDGPAAPWEISGYDFDNRSGGRR